MTALALERIPRALPDAARRWTKPWNIVVLGLPVLGIAVLGYHRRWISDDGLITTRVVRQIVAGHGPVTNLGERAEASTSTLWTWLLAVITWIVDRDPAKIAVYLGLVLTMAGVALAADGTRRLYTPDLSSRWLAPAGALVVVALPPFWDFSTSGLETGPMFGWIGLCWWLLVRLQAGARRPADWILAAILGLGSMIRPEQTMVALVFLGAMWLIVRPGWKRSLAWLGAFAGIPFAYEIFRMGYYGVIFPNTAISKEASGSAYDRGWTYLMDTVSPYYLWLPFLVLAVALGFIVTQRRKAKESIVLPAAAVLAGLLIEFYVLRIGGDFMHGRMNLPAIFLVLLPVFVLPLGRNLASTAAVAAASAVTAVWAVLCIDGFRVHVGYTYEGTINWTSGISNERMYYAKFTRTANPTSAAPYIRANLALVDVLKQARATGHPMLSDYGQAFYPMRSDVGANVAEMWSYLGTQGAIVPLDEITLDAYTLSYPLGSHMQLTGRGRAGHEKRIPDYWIVADYGTPDAAAVGPADYNHDPDFAEHVAQARQALSCGRLAELQHAVRDPLTASRFWDNLTGAVSRTSLRFPENAAAAVSEFCR